MKAPASENVPALDEIHCISLVRGQPWQSQPVSTLKAYRNPSTVVLQTVKPSTGPQLLLAELEVGIRNSTKGKGVLLRSLLNEHELASLIQAQTPQY